MAVTFNKFNSFTEAVAKKVHNLGADALTIALTAAANAPVGYQWAGDDTDTAGEYQAEFEVTIGGVPITFPNQGFLTVTITEDLG